MRIEELGESAGWGAELRAGNKCEDDLGGENVALNGGDRRDEGYITLRQEEP